MTIENTSGDVTITLYGELKSAEHVLKCGLEPFKKISNAFGGFVPALRALQSYDMTASVAIVAAGLGKTAKEVEADVFRTGLIALVEPLTDYLNALMHGGRKADDSKPAT
jgi:hypothetical protein